jgi:hypothetical protein
VKFFVKIAVKFPFFKKNSKEESDYPRKKFKVLLPLSNPFSVAGHYRGLVWIKLRQTFSSDHREVSSCYVNWHCDYDK